MFKFWRNTCIQRLFHTIVDNGRITNPEFDNGWHSADFALLSDADSLFSVLDHNNDQAITAQPDMSHLFTSYDNNRKLRARIQIIFFFFYRGERKGSVPVFARKDIASNQSRPLSARHRNAI